MFLAVPSWTFPPLCEKHINEFVANTASRRDACTVHTLSLLQHFALGHPRLGMS